MGIAQDSARWCKMVQDGARWCKMVQDGAIWCKIMQYHAIPCNTMQYHAIPCNTMQYHAIQCDTMQYHAIPCNTMQYHACLITADGAYHCPVGSIWPFLSKNPPHSHGASEKYCSTGNLPCCQHISRLTDYSRVLCILSSIQYKL